MSWSILYCCVYAVVGPGMVFCETLYALMICIVLPPVPISFCHAHRPISSEPEAMTLALNFPRVVRSAPPGKYVSLAAGILLHAVVVLEFLNFFM